MGSKPAEDGPRICLLERRCGALDPGILGSPRSLTSGRLPFQRPLRTLRARATEARISLAAGCSLYREERPPASAPEPMVTSARQLNARSALRGGRPCVDDGSPCLRLDGRTGELLFAGAPSLRLTSAPQPSLSDHAPCGARDVGWSALGPRLPDAVGAEVGLPVSCASARRWRGGGIAP
jgi:hypothetical protein